MSVRGTEKHKYCTNDRLGQGATGNVFKGISKDGKFRALKVFERYAVKDITREVGALQKLKHENIVHFFGVENELVSGQVVVVMEFCEGGSLASYLQEPDNVFGLPDSEFLLLLRHLVQGMEHLRTHGFVHRDIKPGNILRCVKEDGTSLFKLSDFGTARPLEDDEYFKSLVGTEEYLHPDLFSAAFMNDEGKSLRFPHCVDLWSLGATLYNAASGDVPFCPYLRRRDHQTMHEMITNKPAGAIGARQERQNGEIVWLYELPDTCQLSGGLQKRAVGLFVALFERDPSKAWSFEQFFQETQGIVACEAITLLAVYPHHSPFDCLYLPHLHSVAQLRKALGERWRSDEGRLCRMLYGESPLSDWLEEDDQLFDMPPTDPGTPLTPLPSALPHAQPESALDLSMAKVVSDQLSFSGAVPYSDSHVARQMCGTVALIDRRTKALALFQKHLLKIRHRLRLDLRREVQQVEKLFQTISELFDVISGTADRDSWSKQEDANFELVKQKMTLVDDKIKSATRTVKLPFEDNQWNFDGGKCGQRAGRLRQEAEQWHRELKSRSRSKVCSMHSENCIVSSRQHLEAVYKKALRLWSEQCFQKSGLLRESFLDWYRCYLSATQGLQACQEDLSTVVSLVGQLFKSCASRAVGMKVETQKVNKSLLSNARTKADESQLTDLKNMLRELTHNLEDPEVFGVPRM